ANRADGDFGNFPKLAREQGSRQLIGLRSLDSFSQYAIGGGRRQHDRDERADNGFTRSDQRAESILDGTLLRRCTPGLAAVQSGSQSVRSGTSGSSQRAARDS